MGAWEKYVEKPVKKIGSKIDDEVFEPVKGVGSKIDDEILQPVKNTVEAIAKDPKKLAAVAIAVAFPGAGAALGAQLGLSGVAAQVVGQTIINTVTNGGDVKAAVISAALPVVGKEVAGTIGSTLAKSGITGSVNTVITDAATRGLTAAALGKDPLAAMVLSGTTSAVNLIAAEIPGFSGLHPSAQSTIKNAVATKLTGGNVGQSLVDSAISYATSEFQKYRDRESALKDLAKAGLNFGTDYSKLNPEQKAAVDAIAKAPVKTATGSAFDKLLNRPGNAPGTTRDELIAKYKDSLYTDESEAREMARAILGRNPTEFEIMEFIGTTESNAKSILENIYYDEATFDSNELAESYKALYGKAPTAKWLAENMDLLGRSEAQGKNMLQNLYVKDKNTVTKDEAVDFWKKAGFTDTPNAAQLKDLMGLSEANAETFAIRANDIEQTTFNGAGYGTQANAQKAAAAAGYNTYSWNGKEYNIPTTAEAQKIEDKRYELTEGILKSQGTTIAKATDKQLQAAMDKVNAVPTGLLGNATLKDVVSGKYSILDAQGKIKAIELTAPVYAETNSASATKAAAQLPPGMVLAKNSDVWGAGGARNANVEYMVLPDGTSAWVKRSDGKEITQLPEQVIVGKRLDELAVSDPEAWLQMASQFDKGAKGTVSDYLVTTANSLMLGAYATGNKKFGDNVKQTLSLATQAAGEQTANLASAFASQFGLSYDNAFVQAGKALQAWGAANQTASTKKQEEDFFKRISDAKGVAEKIKAIPGAILDYPGGFATMVLKEGMQEILPLWAARSVAHLGRLAAHSANTAVEVMEVWGNGAGETYAEAIKMGYSEQDARVMASKVGLQSAAITAVTNGIGDIALVNRVIGGAVKDSLAGVTKAGVKEGITEYFDELGQNAAKQYQLTGKVNWDQATTAATIGMGVGAGTTSGIMLGASINSAAVIGKDSFGKNVSYADFMSGEKQVDMKTVNLNTQVGTAKDGDPITLGSITAMPMASGISYDMVTSGLPPSLTSMNVSVGKDALGNDVTLSGLLSGVNKDTSFDTLYKNLLNTTPEQSKEAQTKLITDTFKTSGYTPSAAEINALIAAKPTGTTAIKDSVSTYVAPRQVTEAEAKKFFADIGYKPTDAEVKQFVKSGGNVSEAAVKADVAKYVAPLQVTDADARKFFADIGYKPTDAEVKQFVKQAKDADVLKEVSSYVDPRQVTEAEAEKFFADLGYKPTKAEIDSYIKQGGANTQSEILSSVGKYVDPRLVTEQEAKDAYAALGLSKPTQADVLKLVGQYDQTGLTDKATANLDSARYNSILDQLDSLSVGASQETLDAIDLVKNDLNAQITALGGDVTKLQSGLDSVVAGQADAAAQLTDLQKSLAEEIQAAKDIGLEGDAAIQAGLDSLAEKVGTNQADLLTQLGTTAADLKTQFATDIAASEKATAQEIADTKTALETAIADAKAAGLKGDEALKAAIDAVAADQETNAADLLTKLGTTEANLKTEFEAGLAGVSTEISDTRKALEDAITAAEAAGLSRDEAITSAVESVAADLGTTKADLLTQLGATEETLRGEFSTGLAGVSAEVKAAYDALSADQKALATQLNQQGTDLATAIQQAKEETAGQIETLSADVQAKYDALTAEQKALADAMNQQGLDLTAAIDLAAQQTQAQITGLGEQVDTRINELMQQGQTYQQATQQAIGELNTQNQQLQSLVGTQGRQATQADIDALSQMLGGQRDVDLTYDVTGDKQITQADIDFLTQVVSGVNTDWRAPVGSAFGPTGLYGQLAANEAQRQADLQAQLAREQEAAAAAAEAQRQATIRTTLGQGQQQLQRIAQQIPQAFQQAQTTTTPIYGQMGPYLDLGSPLDFDFFKPSPEKQAATKQQQPTKIATGGYIDDLLAGDMTVDELLNLLR